MATGFGRRLQLASELEQAFIESFNAVCHPHVIVKFGIESTRLNTAQEHLRHRYDPTSRFLRYMPDSVLIDTRHSDAPSALVEFKVAATGIYSERFFAEMKAECPDMNPPFRTIQDVFGVEKEALDGYRGLEKLNVPVIVVGWAKFRSDNPLRAQFANTIAICEKRDPNQGRGSAGSGTRLYNTNFASFDPVGDFFQRVCEIDPTLMAQVENSVLGRPS